MTAFAIRSLSVLLMVAGVASAQAPQAPQAEPLDADERAAVVERTSRLLVERYVFLDVAEACGAHIQAQLDAGEFDDISDPDEFARTLTQSLQSVSHDKHMRVRLRPPAQAQRQQENPARAQRRAQDRERQQNFGFEKVERLEGNVGYVDMRYFSGSPDARTTATAAMNFLANADAIIFDMRQNGGGHPGLIQYICSYLFDAPTHLNSLYWRQGDRTEEFWTLDDVPGPKMPDVPVFVLTSSYTFSGAEEFSYNLQTQHRATLVGETTGGGANPGGEMPVNHRFGIFIPTGRAINPVTGTNWEGIGVVPEIAVDADEALDKALAMAQEAAEAFRAEAQVAADALWADLEEGHAKVQQLIEQGRTQEAAAVIAKVASAAIAADLLGEMDINMMGYQLLGQEQPQLAIAVLELNAKTYPESSNVYDSLGEAYMNDGQIELAIKNYRKSLELDPGNGNAQQMIKQMQSDR